MSCFAPPSKIMPHFRRIGWVVVRLSLVLSLWHAPLPVLHAHTLSFADLNGNPLLADHLVRYHCSEGDHLHSTDVSDTDWHWHFVIPNCDGCCSDSDDHHPLKSTLSVVWKMVADSTESHTSITSLLQLDLNHLASMAWSAGLPIESSIPRVHRGLACESISLDSDGEISLLELLSRRLC